MLREYYRVHGYDEESGIPLREKLMELDLPQVASRLYEKARTENWDGPPLWDLDDYPGGGRRA